MLARVAMPAVRQKRSNLAPTSCKASSMVATGTTAAVVGSFMALLSFVDSAPRAYRLKVGNACPPISTSTGTSPDAAAVLVKGYAAGIVGRIIAEGELDLGCDVIRVRQISRAADRDDQPGAVRLHIAHRVIDGIGISIRRIHIGHRAVDERHVGVELPIIGRCRICPLAILAH